MENTLPATIFVSSKDICPSLSSAIAHFSKLDLNRISFKNLRTRAPFTHRIQCLSYSHVKRFEAGLTCPVVIYSLNLSTVLVTINMAASVSVRANHGIFDTHAILYDSSDATMTRVGISKDRSHLIHLGYFDVFLICHDQTSLLLLSIMKELSKEEMPHLVGHSGGRGS
ncbi:hypothetical protein G6F57_013021 [Rhizopus arrhizus]|uniref:Uncharacterized protein n=1 Tax=Rhizopus oryzae TaxID=64495 RepID=A0A9P7BRL3_RHIOR|nr:hypothetical protein G6F21_012117 [Rhizopus arrhizus]KAG1399778.1 hypothetical protein G6F58_011066 [Rhizopus delemar]KAG0780655.1 hypothetical protein G6F22_009967 [Rhizopus arrhizus]KAG0805129.1 hypothetical protein G6F20_012154 [Rhizopus arrhizus]KAG0824933.1 hypothetical protein G6F19_010069 [Rhizopus arrhizus]